MKTRIAAAIAAAIGLTKQGAAVAADMSKMANGCPSVPKVHAVALMDAAQPGPAKRGQYRNEAA